MELFVTCLTKMQAVFLTTIPFDYFFGHGPDGGYNFYVGHKTLRI